MGNKSLLELLQEEHKLCSRLQSVENMLDGLRGDAEGAEQAVANLNRYDGLVHRLTEESAEIREKLHPVRVEIGDKIRAYSDLSEEESIKVWTSIEPGEVTANA